MVAGVLVTRQVGAQKQQSDPKPSSYTPVVEEPFDVVRARDKATKADVRAAHRQSHFLVTPSLRAINSWWNHSH